MSTAFAPAGILPADAIPRALLDAIPSYVFVLDGEARILDANRAAIALLGTQGNLLLRRLCGEVLLCVHAHEPPGGCGTTETCKECQIRLGAARAAAGGRIERKLHQMRLETDGKARDFAFLVTAAPIDDGGRRLALLLLEDVTELVALRAVAPICAHCKRVRNDKQFWESVEAWLLRNQGLRFSHGICPECEARHFPPQG